MENSTENSPDFHERHEGDRTSDTPEGVDTGNLNDLLDALPTGERLSGLSSILENNLSPEMMEELMAASRARIEAERPDDSILNEGILNKGALCEMVKDKFQAECETSPSMQEFFENSGDTAKPLEPGQ